MNQPQEYDLSRFITAHQRDYKTALSEIRNGHKTSHWMWYIFPQLKGLGRSSTSEYYGIQNLEEASAFLNDPYLGQNLIEISAELLELDTNNATAIFGKPDDMKLQSSMTLFNYASTDNAVFLSVLEKYYDGREDYLTLRRLGL